MQIPLLAGRWISPGDRANSESVVIIDNRLAKKFWPNQSPIGQHISDYNSDKQAVVVGVVATIRNASLEQDTSDGMRYYALAQNADGTTNFLARTDGDPVALAPAIRRAIASADGTQTASDVQPLESLVSGSLAGRRLIVDMLAAFAGLALLLAIVGIYGLISYVTNQRTVEVGLRMAVGAQRIDVILLVLRGALAWVLSGLDDWRCPLGCRQQAPAPGLRRLRFGSTYIACDGGACVTRRGNDRCIPACSSRCVDRTDSGSAERIESLAWWQRSPRLQPTTSYPLQSPTRF